MQLFVHITNHEESVTPILEKMFEAGMHGATVLDCKGMLGALCEAEDYTLPIFGALRAFSNPQGQPNKMIIVVLCDEDIPVAREIVHSVSGNLKLPNTGILFSVPVMNWEGVPHNQ